jgi:hypothetical protein
MLAKGGGLGHVIGGVWVSPTLRVGALTYLRILHDISYSIRQRDRIRVSSYKMVGSYS